MAMLARVVLASSAHAPLARGLLEETLAFLLTEKKDRSTWAFPAHEGVDEPARLGWCYGDLSVAFALLWSARALENARLEVLALDVARRSTARSPASGAVTDAGLCHGASGIAHMYRRLYEASDDDVFDTAADAWYGRALAYVDRGSLGEFLNGQSGFALALLGRARELGAWDEVLATNV